VGPFDQTLPAGLADYGIGLAPPPPPGVVPGAPPPGLPPGLVLPPGIAGGPVLPAPGEAPALPQVDAISGAAEATPQVFKIPDGLSGPAPAPVPGAPPPLQTGNAQLDQAMSEQAQTIAAGGEIASREKAATGELLGQRNTRITELEDKAQKQYEDDQAWSQELSKRYDAAVQAEADHVVDRGRRYKNMSTGNRMMAGIGAIMAGLGQALESARVGGRPVGANPVIEMMAKAAEDDVNDQIAEGEKKARRIGLAGQTMERFSALSKDRQARFNLQVATELERTARDIEAAAAGYDSEEALINAQRGAAELREKAAGYQTKAVEAEWNREMEDRKFKEQVTARKTGNAIARAGLAQSASQFDRSLEERQKDRLLDAAKLEQAGQVEAAKALRENMRRERELEIPGATIKGGAPLLARTPEEAKKIREKQAAVDSIAQIIDETVRYIEKEGGSSSTLRSDVNQKVTSNIATIKSKVRIAEEMGALDKGSAELIGQTMGGADATSFLYNASPGLKQVREHTVKGFTNVLRAQEPNALDYVPASTATLADPGKNPIDDAAGRLLNTPTPLDANKAEQKTGIGKAVEGALQVRLSGTELNSERAAKRAEAAAADPSRKDIDLLIDTASRGGEDGTRAKENLLQVAKAKPELSGAVLRALAERGDVATFDEVAAAGASVPGADVYARQMRSVAQETRIGQLGEAASGGDLAAAQALIDLTAAPDPAVSKAAVEALVKVQARVAPRKK
jgi:hypothetical protein